ncbi:MAG: type II secretion system protein GspD [Verrucomicrobiales bacterium]|nr:type II secretion system protein GspD [Verrucomicrobiales bacterium]
MAADRPVATVELDQPKVSRGLVFAESTDAAVRELARQLDAPTGPGEPTAPPTPTTPPPRSAPATPVEESPPALESGRLISMPRLNGTELREVLDSLRLRLATERGYRAVRDGRPPEALPSVPAGVESVTTYTRQEGEATRVLRFGIHPFVSRPSELWIEAVRRRGSGGWEADPELAQVEALAGRVIAVTREPKPDLGRDDLEFRIIQISYIDTEGAIEALKGFGIETAESLAKVAMPVPFQKLPMVARMPSPDAPEVALLGAEAQKTAASFELSVTPSMATPLPADPNLARASQLLVYFHPAHPEQFTRVRKLLEQYIDRPAQQIFIEGLVLEISESGLKELGVEWQYREGGAEFSIGNLFPGVAAASSAGMSYDSLRDLEQQWTVRLRALIEEEKAEILSRPSVLTLNNRQATIRVGQEIPIATSSEAGIVKDANRISFNFKYLPTGISLNIRPRIAEDANEVSMLVDTVVSSAIPGADLELRSSSGEVLASAPTIATRRVQTYTRIGNNTPFIIGGLVNREFTQVRRKVPLLGDIPYLGTLFRSRSTKSRKQEVIIVLTPHVLPEAQQERAWGRYLPRDDDKFDDVGNALYRASYRIREQDILDLSFLDRSEQLRRYRSLAQRAIDSNFHLAERPPFSLFADGRSPGEHILVERMIYEVLKRLSDQDPGWLQKRIAAERLIFFSGRNAGGYDVQFLHQAMASLGDGLHPESFFAQNPGKALAVVFRARPEDPEVRELGLNQSPIPELSLVDCPDRKTWGELLWSLNHADEKGTPRAAILIRDPEDLVRLQRAVLLREVVNLNGGPARVNRRTFSLGQVLLVPDENPHDTRVIDMRTAGYFVHTEHYYAATLESLQAAMADLDAALAQPEFQHLR